MVKRYVFGTRSKKWHLVDEKDRDWKHGLTPAKRKSLGKHAKEYYLMARKI